MGRGPGPVAAALALAALCLAAAGVAAGEQIRELRSDVALDRDGTFTVEERIVYDFGSEQRHGIFRDIPVRYGRGAAADYRIELEVLSVTDAAGRSLGYRESSEGASRRIRIGDPNRTVSGVQEYRIRYRVRRGILWLDDHDEVYWNATGNEWPVPILASSASLALPPGTPASDVDAVCFTGPQGSIETACEIEIGEKLVLVEASRGFAPREGLTFAVALPKGVLDEPSALSQFLDRLSDWIGWPTLLPILVLALMLWIWRRHGRDPAGSDAIPVRYEPPEAMTPAEVGTVLDERVDMRDITATLLDLAVRGFLEIEELASTRFLFLQDRDYRLIEAKPADAALKEHERALLAGVFETGPKVKLSDLENQFYKQLPKIQGALYEEVTARGRWFATSPQRVRRAYLAAGIVLIGVGFVIGTSFQDAPLMFSLGVCGGIVLLMSRVMPRRTRAGRRAQEEILGFQEFAMRVEKDRLERLGTRTVDTFERLLPFAFVLGAADAWAEAFADLYTEPPRWYHSPAGQSFQPRMFVTSVGRVLDAAGTAMKSRPRSSGSGSSGFGGGGSSGGGFGGGGGGSW